MNAALELSQLAEAAALERSRCRAKSIQEPLRDLRQVCEEFGRCAPHLFDRGSRPTPSQCGIINP